MTIPKDTPNRLRHGQALALQYAAQVLINVTISSPQQIKQFLSDEQLRAENAVETATLGCSYGTRIILPFIVELALKALTAKHNNDQALGTHRLSQLHDALPENLKQELDRDFENIKHSAIPEETRVLRDILIAHDSDFLGWRYLDVPERMQADDIYILQYVACSILNVYNNS